MNQYFIYCHQNSCGYTKGLYPYMDMSLELDPCPDCGDKLSYGVFDTENTLDSEEMFLIGNFLFRAWIDYNKDAETIQELDNTPIQKFLRKHLFTRMNEHFQDEPQKLTDMWFKLSRFGLY